MLFFLRWSRSQSLFLPPSRTVSLYQAKPVEFSDFVDDQDLEEQLRQALSYDV